MLDRLTEARGKLNEGWDVLNLFDIVRLYDTRDGRENKVGKTTMQEAQLIGRGARYFPFSASDQPEAPRAMRKNDRQVDHPLRLLEQLRYHCSHNPKYIQDIRNALRETGMLDESARTVTLRVKDSFKLTDLYQHGHIWLNDRIKKPPSCYAACSLISLRPDIATGPVKELDVGIQFLDYALPRSWPIVFN